MVVHLDATDWFLYCETCCSLNMFRAPLCPSSGAQELYRWLLPVILGALVYRSLVWCEAVGCVRFTGCFSTSTTGSSHLYKSWAPDDGHNGARNML